MADINRESYFLSELSSPSGSVGGLCRFHIRPEFGSGLISLYSLLPGLYISRNDFVLSGGVLFNGGSGSGGRDVLKLDFNLSGGYEFSGPDGRGHGVEGESGICFAGINRFSSLAFHRGRCDSFSVICSLDRLVPFLDSYWGDTLGGRLERYHAHGEGEGGFCVQPGEDLSSLVTDLLKVMEDEDGVLMRTRTLELLHAGCRPFSSDTGRTDSFQRGCAARVRSFLEEHYREDFTIEDLAVREGVNTSYLKAWFRQEYDTTIHCMKKELRLRAGEILLRCTDLPVKEILYRVGYRDGGKFSRSFRSAYGLSPSEYRESLRSF